MTTAAQLIDKATALLGVRGIGQTLDGAVSADVFGMLQTMLDEFNLEPGLSKNVRETLTLTPGKASYSVNESGDFPIPTPVSILFATYRTGSTDYTVDIIPENQYLSIPDKATTCNIPDWLYFDGSSIYLYPTPSEAGPLTITVKEQAPLFAHVSDDVTLEPGVESAIINNLAVYVAPMFEKMPSQAVMLAASRSKRLLKRANFQPEAVDCPVGSGRVFNIIRGY